MTKQHYTASAYAREKETGGKVKEEEGETAAHWEKDNKALACSGNKDKQDLQKSKRGKKESKYFLGAEFLLQYRISASLGVVAAAWLFPCSERENSNVPACVW